MTRWLKILGLIMAVVSIGTMAVACSEPSSTPISPESTYPADITGQVMITGSVRIPSPLSNTETYIINPKTGNILWVINIHIKNKTYPQPISKTINGHEQIEKMVWNYSDWEIQSGKDIYEPSQFIKLINSPLLKVPIGQTAQMLDCFEVPNSLTTGNTQIVYRGQQPYSYGKLTGGDEVAGYDLLSNKVLSQSLVQPKVVDNWQFQLLNAKWDKSTVIIKLTITNLGQRRIWGSRYALGTGKVEVLAAIDSTNKIIEPYSREPNFSKGELIVLQPYEKEFYPNEDWTGELKFTMSPYSGNTILSFGEFQTRWFPLFDLGIPSKQ